MNGKAKMKTGRKIVRIGVSILLAASCWYLLPYFFGLGVQAVLSGNKVWSAKLVAGLLNTLFRWALLMPVLNFVCGGGKQTDADDETLPTVTKKSFLSYIPVCVSAVVLLISAVLLFPRTASPTDRLKDEYYTRTNMACYNLLGGNIITAVNDYSDIQREFEV